MFLQALGTSTLFWANCSQMHLTDQSVAKYTDYSLQNSTSSQSYYNPISTKYYLRKPPADYRLQM